MHVIRDDFHVIKNITETRRHALTPRDRVEYADTITCSLSLQAVAFHDSPAVARGIHGSCTAVAGVWILQG